MIIVISSATIVRSRAPPKYISHITHSGVAEVASGGSGSDDSCGGAAGGGSGGDDSGGAGAGGGSGGDDFGGGDLVVKALTALQAL